MEKHTKYNIYHFNHSQVPSSVALSTFTMLRYHPLHVVPEHSITPDTPTSVSSHSPASPAPGNP